MAGRPTKEGLDYFPLEVGFFSDDKVEKLEGEHGPLGVYVFLRLLCLIYKDNGYYYTWDDSARALMAKRTGGACTPQKADLIVRSCVKWSLLDGTLLDGCGVLTSQGIQRRYLHAIRERAKKAAAAGRHICVDERFWLLDEKTTAEGFVKVGRFAENTGNNGCFSPEESSFAREESPKEKKRKEKKSIVREREKNAPGMTPDAAPPAAEPTHSVGVVHMSKIDYEAMCRQFGREIVDAKIIHMDSWIQDTGKSPRSCAAKLRDWLTADCGGKKEGGAPAYTGKRTGAHCFDQRSYTDEELNALLFSDIDALNNGQEAVN